MNPTRLSWTQRMTNTDGSPFDASQFAGFEASLNGQVAFAVPTDWDTDGQYEMPLADVAAVTTTGSYSLRLRTIAKSGVVSAWSDPVTFTMDFRTPAAPLNVTVG